MLLHQNKPDGFACVSCAWAKPARPHPFELMVQKAAAMGAPIVVAVSAPTALAVRMAEAAGITLIAVARADGFEVFTHPHRIEGIRRRREA